MKSIFHHFSITGAIRGTSRKKLFAELDLESLRFRRWFRKLACFHKIQSTGSPKYFCRSDTFKNSICSNVINKWNELDEKIKGATSLSLFKVSLLEMGRPYANSTYIIHNPIGIRLLTRLRLGQSHLDYHKFRHNFADCVNPICFRSETPETILNLLAALSQLLKH